MMEAVLRREEERRASSEVCRELAKFYKGDRPLMAWAYALKAIRLGATDVRAQVYATNDSPSSDGEGAYLLGKELTCSGAVEEAMVYLEAAAYVKDRTVAGQAALYLADLLSHSKYMDLDKIDALYHRAAACGNPDILPCLST